MRIPKAERERLELLALQQYMDAVDTVIEAECVIGYRDHDSVEVYCWPPAKVRVVATTDIEHDIYHWNDNYLDPYWDVELVEPHPQLEGLRSLWIDGPSHIAETSGGM